MRGANTNMEITWIGMTRRHYQSGRAGSIRAIVIHATAGRHPGDLGWLRKGGDERRPVSCHYYIDKAGRISQLVKDDDTAWHAGVSRWMLDGHMRENLNSFSLGIELENLNSGRDPYPAAQIAATVALTRDLARRYDVPPNQLVRHLDISPGRKTDPAGFPWEAFVAQVYADQPAPAVAPEQQLRTHMRDLAYRVAGSALSATWPLHATARRFGLGMPVALISGASLAAPVRAAQDDLDRAVRLPGLPPMLVEVYARDLLYAECDGPDDTPPPLAQVRRLSTTPGSPLRTALLTLLFRSADQLNGFRPDWAFHQHFLAHADTLGVPIGPNHRLSLGPRQSYACQHFALDSLCSPVGAWKTIYRLSELRHQVPGLDGPAAAVLRRAILDDLYRARAGRRYDPAALLSNHAEQRSLGAPLGRPEVVMVAEAPYLLMPFARDVLACRLPEPGWPLERPLPAAGEVISLEGSDAPAGVLATLLGGTGLLGRLSPLRRRADPEASPRALLGAGSLQPIVLDLSPGASRVRRAERLPERLLITAAPGPAAADLRDEAARARWHYYIDTTGAIYRLRDEIYQTSAAPDGALSAHAIVVAVEGQPASAGPIQRRSLSWLVRALAATLKLPPEALFTLRQAS
jgi:N-acetyl-anhydromuramyl-L-alanine amidase AmpD